MSCPIWILHGLYQLLYRISIPRLSRWMISTQVLKLYHQRVSLSHHSSHHSEKKPNKNIRYSLEYRVLPNITAPPIEPPQLYSEVIEDNFLLITLFTE